MNKTILEVEGLSKTIKKKRVLDHVSFKVDQGQIVGILGLNGSGKSSLIKTLVGLTPSSQGKILYFGQSLEMYKASILPRLGCVHEHVGFYDHLTVTENLRLVTNIVGVHKPLYMEELLSKFGLEDDSKVRVKHLTLASKRKLALVRALLNQPSVLILDEPLNDLDLKTRKLISDVLLGLAKEKNMAIIISSHVLAEIEKLSDVLVVMHNGKVLKIIDRAFLETYQDTYHIFNIENPQKGLKVLNQAGFLPYLDKKNHLMLATKDVSVESILDIIIKNHLDCYEMYPHVLSLEDYFNHLIRNEIKQS